MSERIELQLEPSHLDLEAGSRAGVTLTVINRGSTIDQFTVYLEGLPAAWYTLTTTAVSLFPEGREQVRLELHPPRATEVQARTYPYRLVVASRQDPAETTLVEGGLAVGVFGGLALTLEPGRARGRSAVYQLVLRNTGNADRLVLLSASDPEEALGLHGLPERPVSVPAGGSVEIPVTARPRQRPLTGPDQSYQFQVRATPPGVEWEEQEAQTVAGEFIYAPYLRAWPWAAWPRWFQRVAAVGIPLAALALIFLMLRPREAGRAPVITFFGPVFNAAAPGPNIHLDWNVLEADQGKVQLKEQEPKPQAAGDHPALQTSQRIPYELEAGNQFGERRAQSDIYLLQPPQIRNFAADPSGDERGQFLQLQWDIVGAARVLVDGKQVEGSNSLRVEAGAARTFVLSAENAAGAVSQSWRWDGLCLTPVQTISNTSDPSQSTIDSPSGFQNIGVLEAGGPFFAQNDPDWADEPYDHALDKDQLRQWCGTTMAQCGCATTSMATILALYGILTTPSGETLNPSTLNKWLNGGEVRRTKGGLVTQGYVYGDVVWTAINAISAEVAREKPGTPVLRYAGWGTGSEEEIRSELAAGRPVILEVPGHFIAAVALEGDTIKINDPYYRDRTTLDAYKGRVRSSRLFARSEGDDRGAILIAVPSDVRIQVTDSQGRVTGSLESGPPEVVQQQAAIAIPNSTYRFEAAWRDPSCIAAAPAPEAGVNIIYIANPGDETFTIEARHPEGGVAPVAVQSYDETGTVKVETVDGSQTSSEATLTYDSKNSDNTHLDPKGTPTPTSTVTVTVTPPPTPTPTVTVTPTLTPTPGGGRGTPVGNPDPVGDCPDAVNATLDSSPDPVTGQVRVSWRWSEQCEPLTAVLTAQYRGESTPYTTLSVGRLPGTYNDTPPAWEGCGPSELEYALRLRDGAGQIVTITATIPRAAIPGGQLANATLNAAIDPATGNVALAWNSTGGCAPFSGSTLTARYSDQAAPYASHDLAAQTGDLADAPPPRVGCSPFEVLYTLTLRDQDGQTVTATVSVPRPATQPKLAGATLAAAVDPVTKRVTLTWNFGGGCPPFNGSTLTARYAGDQTPYASYDMAAQLGTLTGGLPARLTSSTPASDEVHGQINFATSDVIAHTGTLFDAPPVRQGCGPFEVLYTLALRDRDGQTVTVTAKAAVGGTPLVKLGEPQLTAEADPITGRVKLTWGTAGGCDPVTTTLKAQYSDQTAPYATHLPSTRTGILQDTPPVRQGCGPYEVLYTLTVRDRDGETVTTTDKATAGGTPAAKLASAALAAQADPATGRVALSWEGKGGCAPYSGSVTAQYSDQPASYATHALAGLSGVQQDTPPVRQGCGPFEVFYTLTLRDRDGVAVTATAKAAVGGTPLAKLTSATLTATVHAITRQVTVTWDATGGCEPLSGVLTARQTGQQNAYNERAITGRSGSLTDTPPSRPGCEWTQEVTYTLNLRDRDGESVPASARATVVGPQCPIVESLQTPTVRTEVHDPGDADITGKSVESGTAVHAKVTTAGETATPTGLVTFELFPNSTCTGTAIAAHMTTGKLAAGGAAESPAIPDLEEGVYGYRVSYAGAGRYRPAASACAPFAVGRIAPAIRTEVRLADGTDITGESAPAPVEVHDWAVVTGASGFARPTGIVEFLLFPNDSCFDDLYVTDPETRSLAPDGTAESTPFPVRLPGSYSYQASYDFDEAEEIYTSATGPCEPFTVLGPSIETDVHDTDHTLITSAPVGTAVHASVTVTPAAGGPALRGFAAIDVYFNSCTDETFTEQVPLTLVPDGTAESSPITLPKGNYAYQVTYSAVELVEPGVPPIAVLGPCVLFTVRGVEVDTEVHDDGHTPAAGPLPFPTNVHARASVEGVAGLPAPTGNVAFQLFANNSCTGAPDPINVETRLLGADGTAESTPISDPPLTPGNYSYQVSYAGDAVYPGATGGCATFAVQIPEPRTLYVAPSGDDVANDCLSEARRCKTIAGAMGKANTFSGDTIQVAEGTYAERLTINKSLTLRGAGASFTIVDGGAEGTVVTVLPGMTVNLESVFIRNGRTGGNGGGIHNSGRLTITNSSIGGNVAGGGGGIHNVSGGTVSITDSTISGNSGSGGDAGISNRGGSVTINSSLISSNTAAAAQGGIANYPGSSMLIINSTISDNRSNQIGGIGNGGTMTIISSTIAFNRGMLTSGIGSVAGSELRIKNSIVSPIVSDEFVGDACGVAEGTLISGGYNLEGASLLTSNTCRFNTSTDLNVGSAGLGPLQDNGGPTHTHELLLAPESPALNHVPLDNCTDAAGARLTEDQRGQPRPSLAHPNCDIGAYENQIVLLSIAGLVSEATTGHPVPGATVRAIRSGATVATATTGTDGRYAISGMSNGAYVLEAQAPGYLHSQQDSIERRAGQTTTVNFTLATGLAPGELRLVLTWGGQPLNLDAHLWLPAATPYHVYYGRKGGLEGCPSTRFDGDDAGALGPEIITIKPPLRPGTYRYAVQNRSGGPALSASQARVRVYGSTGLLATLDVPAQGPGPWWNVLSIDGATGALTPVNQLGDDPSPYPDAASSCGAAPAPGSAGNGSVPASPPAGGGARSGNGSAQPSPSPGNGTAPPGTGGVQPGSPPGNGGSSGSRSGRSRSGGSGAAAPAPGNGTAPPAAGD